MAISGKNTFVTAMGVLFVWSGIKGWSILGTVKDVITGIQPSGVNVYPVLGANAATPNQTGTVGGAPLGGNLASVAQGYVGHSYSFGGAPGRDGSNAWDCSSMVNYLASVKLGLPIPGYGPGKYDGTSHGPITTQWGVWPGLSSVDRASLQAGDLVIWTGHMGIAVDQENMISALDEADGTKVTPIDGYGNGPLMRYGRYNAYLPYDKGAQ